MQSRIGGVGVEESPVISFHIFPCASDGNDDLGAEVLVLLLGVCVVVIDDFFLSLSLVIMTGRAINASPNRIFFDVFFYGEKIPFPSSLYAYGRHYP